MMVTEERPEYDFEKHQREKCQEKVPYETLTEAQAAKIFADRKWNKVHKIYRCPYCKKLHLATDKSKTPKKRWDTRKPPKPKPKQDYKKVKTIEKL